jgi:MFS family permease
MIWRDSLVPLRAANFRWYFLSRFANTLGGMMAGVALAFAVLAITDSATALGQVLAAHTIPMVLFLLGGGVIADRFPRATIIQLANVICVLNAISSGALFTLGPLIAKQTIGEQGWGYVLSAESLGVLLTTAVTLRVRLERPLLFGMLGISLLSVPILLLGVRPELELLVVAMLLAGAGMELFSLGWTLAMQENIDDAMLSRASSYDALGSFIAMPAGQLAFGPLGAAFGFERVMTMAGVAYGAICLLTLLSPSVRMLPRRSQSGPLHDAAAPVR